MRLRNRMTGIIVLALATALSPSLNAQSAKAAQSANSAQQGQQTHITLPQYPPELPQGPHLEAFRAYCLECHSARYVTTQPNFSTTVWQNEVKKMVTVYGAPISDVEQAKIVEYLVAIKGAPPSAPSASAPSKPEAPK